MLLLESLLRVRYSPNQPMRLSCRAVLVFTLLASLEMLAQDNSGVVGKIESIRFSPLTRQAKIQGDVRLRSGPDGVRVISGHPLLTDIAVDSLKALGKISDGEVEATYHFVLIDNTETRLIHREEQRGNRFTRFFLRLFRMKTVRVVDHYHECVEHPVGLKNRVDFYAEST
jgi:hypothetical protein